MSLADSIKLRLQDWQKIQLNANDFTISRVPPDMFEGKQKYFEPSVISIGPYHLDNDKYKAMEHHKWGQLQDLLARNPLTNVETLVQELRSLELRTRRCYFEPIIISSDDFVEMLLLDGCFILELFLKKKLKYHGTGTEFSHMSKHSLIIDQIYNDILFLENQIPFFVLQTLFDCLDLQQLVHASLITILTEETKNILGEAISVSADNTNIYHLLHLFHQYRYCIAPKIEQANTTVEEDNSFCFNTMPSAKRLQEAGITLKKKTSPKSLLDITFNEGVLEIPLISIDDYTCALWMNLVAFEQSNVPPEKRLVSSYMGFMDDIIDTAEDAEILEKNGILESFLNCDYETALFFNHITDYADVGSHSNHLASVIDKVNKHTKSCWPRWRAKFIRDYIFSPWAVFSLIAALLLISLAFIQTFCTVYPCNKQL